MSDLHLDVRAKTATFTLPEQRPECDAVIIAGDVREDALKAALAFADGWFLTAFSLTGKAFRLRPMKS
jgi:predicted phosphodiesterase